MELTIQEILFRLSLSLIFSAVIGTDRKWKNRPAGVRTHALVCIGATAVALIQCQIEVDAISYAIANPELVGIIRSDPARLICQVISGVGFLGAGTIIVTKRAVAGLTTAASLWATACMGVAVGLGYYTVATLTFLYMMLILSVLKKILRLHICRCLEVQYSDIEKTKLYLAEFFETRHLKVKMSDYDINFSGSSLVCTNHVIIKLSQKTDFLLLVEELASNPSIIKIKTSNL